MEQSPSRQIEVDCVSNLRDLGGYRTRDGRRVAWRRLLRGGEPRHESLSSVLRLRDQIGLASVLDLRSDVEIRPERVAFLKAVDIRYHNVPLEGDGISAAPESDFFSRFTGMGDFYLFMLRSETFSRRLISALEVVADTSNHPVLFHCTVGKDRTGILAAFILDILGVGDDDILADYAMTGLSMPEFIERMRADVHTSSMLELLPSFFWEASAHSMESLLGALRAEHGSLRSYLEARGAGQALFQGLEKALLE